MFGLSHIGIAVANLEEAKKAWIDIGFVLDHETEVPEQKVKVAKLKWNEMVIELLEPVSDDSPIKGFLEKRGPGIHHIAYEVEDIEAAIQRLIAQGARMIDAVPRNGAHGTRIAFVHPKSSNGVLTELCQSHH